ncbi:MAG: DNA polymerase III subunit delta [Dehalococcoidia bacterium]|nr:DNA polymerase III subunit delta [Dehalococcoidia bacterium]
MLYVLHGPDQFRAREELRAIRDKLDRDGNLANATVRFEGRGLSAGDLRGACHTASFFAEDRLVIVDGLQTRFSGARRRGGRAARTPRAGAASDLDQFAEVLTNLPPTTTVVLLDEQPSAAFIEAVAEVATVRQFPTIKGAELRQWAVQRVRSQQAEFAPAALERLISLVDGFHLGELAQEIDKLATYAGARLVEVADVDTLVSGAVQHQIWDLTDAVVEGRGDRALAVLKAMDARDHPAQLLIFMLVRQYRQVVLAQALLRDGLSADQIGSRLGSSGYPLRKVIDQASRYAADRLEAAYRRLLETDVAVKTGVLEVDMALELLILDLAELGRPQRRVAATR